MKVEREAERAARESAEQREEEKLEKYVKSEVKNDCPSLPKKQANNAAAPVKSRKKSEEMDKYIARDSDNDNAPAVEAKSKKNSKPPADDEDFPSLATGGPASIQGPTVNAKDFKVPKGYKENIDVAKTLGGSSSTTAATKAAKVSTVSGSKAKGVDINQYIVQSSSEDERYNTASTSKKSNRPPREEEDFPTLLATPAPAPTTSLNPKDFKVPKGYKEHIDVAKIQGSQASAAAVQKSGSNLSLIHI
eukprot:TRINITY_DN4420_c0_g1_i3.p1 TRINITY_DN4420_c0_g1~~TRINITY_DN4420_c0_g1_i3.p1  ORF type:complete len:248 (-),score=45.26 TRINITY_DN4420_c0_g1_i3:59-802(-)